MNDKSTELSASGTLRNGGVYVPNATTEDIKRILFENYIKDPEKFIKMSGCSLWDLVRDEMARVDEKTAG